ncbi:MAG: BatA domain-containing protein [Bacteroidales bacterium]|nr:BatA domain-containing protein [Bacteroidales bacterium]
MIFANPIMLLGLIAVAVPVVVHLFNFRRYKRVLFSNVSRLSAMQSQTRRRSNLRRLLILAARILAIVFLVLAFAQPVLPNREQQLQSGSTAVSIFVDNSYSMENAGTDGSLLSEASAKVAEIAAAYGPETRFQLLSGDMAGHQFRWLDREELIEAAANLEESANTVNLSQVARRQLDFLHNSNAKNLHLYIISDFQQTVTDIEQLPSDSSVQATLVPLEAASTDNIFFDTLVLNAPAYVRGATVVAEATLRNTGSRDVEKLPVKLYVDGRERAMASVDIPAGGHATAAMRFAVEADGPQDCRVETTDYPVCFDDQLYFSLNIAGPVQATIVNGAATNSYLTRLFEADSSVTCRQTYAATLDYTVLGNSNFVVLNELRSISSGLAQTLHRYLDEGGALLIVPPAEADLASYNDFLSQLSMPRMGTFQRRKLRATNIDLGSRLYRNVFAGHNDDMEMPTVNGHYPTSMSANTVREQVIGFADGSDLLLLTPVGKGVAYLLTAPLDANYSDFAEQALFVPTIYNMALFSRQVRQPYFILGSESPIVLGGNANPDEVPHLVSTDGSTDIVPDLRRLGRQTVLIPHGQPNRAGNYRLRLSSGMEEALAFNYDHRESDMTFISRTDLATRLRTAGLGTYSVLNGAGLPLDEQIRARNSGRELWRLCLLLALAMIGIEIALILLPLTKKEKK